VDAICDDTVLCVPLEPYHVVRRDLERRMVSERIEPPVRARYPRRSLRQRSVQRKTLVARAEYLVPYSHEELTN
jgi:hypothetical protein